MSIWTWLPWIMVGLYAIAIIADLYSFEHEVRE